MADFDPAVAQYLVQSLTRTLMNAETLIGEKDREIQRLRGQLAEAQRAAADEDEPGELTFMPRRSVDAEEPAGEQGEAEEPYGDGYEEGTG